MASIRIRAGRNPFVKPGKVTKRRIYYEPNIPMPPGAEFDAHLVNPFNWEGGNIFKCIRGSKKSVWACKMCLSEGFTIIIKGKKIRGNPGNWLIIDGTEKYILTERIFRKKFWRNNEKN